MSYDTTDHAAPTVTLKKPVPVGRQIEPEFWGNGRRYSKAAMLRSLHEHDEHGGGDLQSHGETREVSAAPASSEGGN
jgi:hypothetical protein